MLALDDQTGEQKGCADLEPKQADRLVRTHDVEWWQLDLHNGRRRQVAPNDKWPRLVQWKLQIDKPSSLRIRDVASVEGSPRDVGRQLLHRQRSKGGRKKRAFGRRTIRDADGVKKVRELKAGCACSVSTPPRLVTISRLPWPASQTKDFVMRQRRGGAPKRKNHRPSHALETCPHARVHTDTNKRTPTYVHEHTRVP